METSDLISEVLKCRKQIKIRLKSSKGWSMKTDLERQLEHIEAEHALKVKHLKLRIKAEAEQRYSKTERVLATELHSSLCVRRHIHPAECDWDTDTNWESDVRQYYIKRAQGILELSLCPKIALKVIQIATNYR